MNTPLDPRSDCEKGLGAATWPLDANLDAYESSEIGNALHTSDTVYLPMNAAFSAVVHPYRVYITSRPHVPFI